MNMFKKSVCCKFLSALVAFVMVLFFVGCEDDKDEKEKPTLSNENAIITVDFEELSVADDGYWNGSDLSGQFVSKGVTFYNDYNSDWSSWSGMAYSGWVDKDTVGYANQYSVYADSGNNGSDLFAIAYPFADKPLISFDEVTCVNGFYINNTTYVYHALKSGDDGAGFVSVFGGDDANAEDYLKVIITGFDADGESLGEVEFYLADYRFEDNSLDYIITDWTWVDLTKLGDSVKELYFNMVSTDVGDWGTNTPSYFAIDDLKYEVKSK